MKDYIVENMMDRGSVLDKLQHLDEAIYIFEMIPKFSEEAK
jgi:hypothetical protein